MSSEARVKLGALAPITSEKQLLASVNNIISTLTPLVGQHSNKNEKVVQWADLMSVGLIKGLVVNPDGSISGVVPDPVLPDMRTPPPIVGFEAVASFNFVTFSWSQPLYGNHAYVELWRAPSFKDNAQGLPVPTTLDDAVFRSMTSSTVCSDTVLPGDKWRYWARNVSKTGVLGGWTSIDGLLVEAPDAPEYILDIISGEIKEGDLYPALGAKIEYSYDGVTTLARTVETQGQTLAEHTVTLASHGTAIQQQAQINTDQGALINAAWTVRIDSGNAVSGFGLMVDGATGRSDFVIRADRFAIAAPQAYDQAGKPVVNTDAFPFIVDVSDPAVPKTLIKNAYIDQAFIQTLVTGSLVADRITGQTLTGTHIRGGDMAIGSNFSVDGAGSLTALNAFIRGTMQSENFGSGTTGWQINNNGNAEFNNAIVRGTGYFTDGVFDGVVYADKIIGDVCKVVSTATSGANIRIDAYKRERTVLITVPFVRLTAGGMGSVHSSTLTLNIYYGGTLVRQLPNFLYSQATGSSAGVPDHGGGFQISFSLPAMQVANAFFTYSVHDTMNGPYNVEVIGPLVMMAFIQ